MTTNNNDEKNVTTEEKEKFLQQEQDREKMVKDFIEKNMKEVPFTRVSDVLRPQVESLVKEFEDVKNEVEFQINFFAKQNQLIEDKIEDLAKTGKVTLNEDEQERVKSSFAKFKASLEHVISDLHQDFSFYSSLISENPPKNLIVFKFAPENIDQYLEDKIRSSKREIKTLFKNLRVSCSKYNFGLESQLRNLDYLTIYLKQQEPSEPKKS